MAESFGDMLREYRAAAGFSMGQLAKRIHYSKGYLSKIENGLKPPHETVARLCDSVLNAGGMLVEAARTARDRIAGEHKLDRRQVLAAGTVFGITLAGGPRPIPHEGVVAGIRTTFEHLRRLGMQTSPVVILESLVAQANTVCALAHENPEPIRSRLLLLAARIAEYTGWMSQEVGDEQRALWWTRRSSELAQAGGDRQITSYALVREAGLALYRQDPITTIDLAQRAQVSGSGSLRVLALAARREAQGHALAGDRDSYQRAMDRAAELLDSSTPDDRAYPELGTSAPDPVELARGWALCDLGKPDDAAAILERELARLPAVSRRTRARFGVRRSLAYVLSGEVDQSCLTLTETLDDVAHVDSATVRMDLRELARHLGRWHNHGVVREVFPDLRRALSQRA
ncbi:helix-turn-helix transcriptional regulator [Kibdelosporangium phytohabitans]|uniref:DNA-binding protein n=1 Tax=Kibdelosporangium phytohabitans TaxID=860235 RepID=A0A0N9HWI6_9PSEU|nr:helix-turn-helix transcriptional regulator [Kibdelosporangium phytohabitans]ALG06196.1 DNA-binding protein [Kibdelosporangium phytohabitans]MBE1465705.1 transcriptional regulator with XRE-family HTH domain/tetratricopeptide (TPR) repeat protein [Kibdelosporangium phytohabitans]